MKCLPERGRIGIFNRSYYEEVAGRARAPGDPRGPEAPARSSSTKTIWEERYQDIRSFERYLARNGVVVRKFFLHVSQGGAEAALPRAPRRTRRRTGSSRRPTRRSAGTGTSTWRAYEDTIRDTATKHAPWYVVPADNKWFTRIVVAAAVIDALASVDLHYPKVSKEKLEELAAARKALLEEK